MRPPQRHVQQYGPVAVLSPSAKVARDRELAAAKRERQRIAAGERLVRKIATDPMACRICGTPISDPRSIARGIGPECWSKQPKETSR